MSLTSFFKYALFGTLGTGTDTRRDQWVQTQLASLKQGSRLLDAGAGEGRFKPFCSHLTYVGQDFGEYEGGGDHGLNPPSWNTSQLDIVCDITDIPEKAGSFDAVLCTEVLEHVPDPISALKELTRLTKKGGTLLVTTPFISGTHFAPYHFCTGFSWSFYEHHLTQMGWKIDVMDIVGDYYDTLAQEVRRLPNMARQQGQRLPLTAYPAIVFMLMALKRLHRTRDVENHFLPSNVFIRATRI